MLEGQRLRKKLKKKRIERPHQNENTDLAEV